MKLKTLITPFLLLLIVILCIWLVYPAYSNGSDGVREKYSQLKKEQAKLNNIQDKSDNVKKIANEISSSAEEMDVLDRFIPLDDKREEIEDNLNYLASSAGLAVLGIRLNYAKGNAESLDSNSTTEATMNVVGTYEALKKFIGDVSKFKRFNTIKTLKISKNVSNATQTNPQDNTNKDVVLKANIKIDFVALAKTKLTDERVNEPIFSEKKLDLAIISQIKNSKTVNILPTKVEEKGKSNPFVLAQPQ